MIPLLAALACAGAIALLGLLLASRRRVKPTERRLRVLSEEPAVETRRLSWDEVRRRGPSSLPYLRDWLFESAWARRMTVDLEAAGLKLRTGEYLMIRFISGLVGFVAVFSLGRNTFAFAAALVGAIVGFLLPAIWVRTMRKRRVDHITRQLPEAVQMIANALRAGFAFQHGVNMVSDQMETPVADEFIRMTVDMNVGASVEDALMGLLNRCDTEEMNLLVTAVLVQRTSGGNLAEILDNVGEQLREKERLVGEVRTMTSQQRFSGTVLVFWPLVMLAFFSLLNWEQTGLLFTTGIGRVLISGSLLLQLVGYYAIRRILDVEV
jgi:tight adherence protein B